MPDSFVPHTLPWVWSQVVHPGSSRSGRSVSPTPGRCLDSGSDDEWSSDVLAKGLEGMKLGEAEVTPAPQYTETNDPGGGEV